MSAHAPAHEAESTQLGIIHSAASSSSTIPATRGAEEVVHLEGDTATESQAPVVPTKHPLSVVDSEELKRKSHGLSLVAPESDDPRPAPIGARKFHRQFCRHSSHAEDLRRPRAALAGVQNRDPSSPTDVPHGPFAGSPKRSRSGRLTTSTFATVSQPARVGV